MHIVKISKKCYKNNLINEKKLLLPTIHIMWDVKNNRHIMSHIYFKSLSEMISLKSEWTSISNIQENF